MPVSAGRLSWLGAPTGMIPLRFCRHSSHFGLRIVVRLVFMRHISPPLLLAALGSLSLALGVASAASREWNPVRSHPVEIGPQASRLVVGFRATPGNSVTRAIRARAKSQVMSVTQAQTSEADVSSLSLRTGVAVSRSRQLTPR